jgi:hypothetical protein
MCERSVRNGVPGWEKTKFDVIAAAETSYIASTKEKLYFLQKALSIEFHAGSVYEVYTSLSQISQKANRNTKNNTKQFKNGASE